MQPGPRYATRRDGPLRAKKGETMSYENLERSLKVLTLTVPAARAFGMTVKFALNESRDTATVFRLEDHFPRPQGHEELHRAHAAGPSRAQVHRGPLSRPRARPGRPRPVSARLARLY